MSWSIADNPWSVSLFQSVLKLCYANMLNSDQTINQMYWYRTAAWAHSVFTLLLNLRTIWWFLSINVFDDWLLFDINKSYLKRNEKTTLTMIDRINENRWRFQSGTECFSMIFHFLLCDVIAVSADHTINNFCYHSFIRFHLWRRRLKASGSSEGWTTTWD